MPPEHQSYTNPLPASLRRRRSGAIGGLFPTTQGLAPPANDVLESTQPIRLALVLLLVVLASWGAWGHWISTAANNHDEANKRISDLVRLNEETRRQTADLKRETEGIRRRTADLKRESEGIRRQTEGIRRHTADLMRETEGIRRQTEGIRQHTADLKRQTSDRERLIEEAHISWAQKYLANVTAATQLWHKATVGSVYVNVTGTELAAAVRWRRHAAPEAPERTCAQPLPLQLLDDILGLAAAVTRLPVSQHTNATRTAYLSLHAFHSTLDSSTFRLTLSETKLTVQGVPRLLGFHSEALDMALLWSWLQLADLPGQGMPPAVDLASLPLSALEHLNSAFVAGVGVPTGLRQAPAYIEYMRVLLPLPQELPELVRELLAWLVQEVGQQQLLQPGQPLTAQALEAALALACNAHTRLVHIHPFADGNGRTARTLSALVLQRAGLPAPMLTRRQQRQYVEALHSATIGRNYAPLALLHASAVRRSLACLLLLAGSSSGADAGMVARGDCELSPDR